MNIFTKTAALVRHYGENLEMEAILQNMTLYNSLMYTVGLLMATALFLLASAGKPFIVSLIAIPLTFVLLLVKSNLPQRHTDVRSPQPEKIASPRQNHTDHIIAFLPSLVLQAGFICSGIVALLMPIVASLMPTWHTVMSVIYGAVFGALAVVWKSICEPQHKSTAQIAIITIGLKCWIVALLMPTWATPYAVYTTLMLIYGAALAVVRKSKCEPKLKSTVQIALITIASFFTCIFLAYLPITLKLLSIVPIPTSLLVCIIALASWLGVTITSYLKPSQERPQYTKLLTYFLGIMALTAFCHFFGLLSSWAYTIILVSPAFFWAVVYILALSTLMDCVIMLMPQRLLQPARIFGAIIFITTIILSSYGFAYVLSSSSLLIQLLCQLPTLPSLALNIELFLFLVITTILEQRLVDIWEKLWLMDTMIDENKQIKNLHFNFLYCLIAHTGGLVFRVADLMGAFTDPYQYIQNIWAHAKFLAIRTWHFFYLQVVNRISSLISDDKTVQAYALYTDKWTFNNTGPTPTIQVHTISANYFEKIKAWECADTVQQCKAPEDSSNVLPLFPSVPQKS